MTTDTQLLRDDCIEWVDSYTRLVALCDQWSQLAYVAVDTEFIRTDTFYPILGLLQVSDGKHCWLIDPLAVTDLLPFAELLADTRVVKVFHACSEDLEVLRHSLGVVPKPVFDTQLAAAFTAHGFSRGYSALVEEILNIELAKHETRSDWLQRPLSQAQCRYGAEDVFYLASVYTRLLAKLQDRLSWVQGDMAELIAKANKREHNSQYYLRIRGAWQLKPRQLAALQKLAQWREDRAQELDKPRNRVLGDKQLLAIARSLPTSHEALLASCDIHPRSARRYGDILLTMIARIKAGDNTDWPEALPQPLPREAGTWMKQLREVQNQIAQKFLLAPEVLARKADLESIIASAYKGVPQLPCHWQGSWREQLIGQAMLASLPDLKKHAKSGKTE